MATSDELKKGRISRSYVITGEGGLCLNHDCSNYASLSEADKSAVERALNLSKSFTGISLYRLSGRHKELILKKSKNPMKKPVLDYRQLMKNRREAS